MEEKDVMMGHPIIDQIDIVPTLATRFGFPIPKNNLGKVISNLYGMENGMYYKNSHLVFYKFINCL